MRHGLMRHHRRWRAKYIVGGIFAGIFGIVALSFILGYVIMQLWNHLMPDLFGLAKISYWHAVGIFILAKLLFGHFMHGRPHHPMKWKCGDEGSEGFHGGWSKWKYYDEFWKEQGKAAFEEYVRQREEQKPSADDEKK